LGVAGWAGTDTPPGRPIGAKRIFRDSPIRYDVLTGPSTDSRKEAKAKRKQQTRPEA